MDYPDKILIYLRNTLKPGQKVEISTIASKPQEFIDTVKYLIDAGWVKDVEFVGDWKFVKRVEQVKCKCFLPSMNKKNYEKI